METAREQMCGATPSGLAFLRQYYQQHPVDLDDDNFATLHEWFLRELSTVDSLAGLLNDVERTSYRNLCSRCHKRYLAIKEMLANKKLLAGLRKAESSAAANLADYSRNASPSLTTTQLTSFRSWRDSNTNFQSSNLSALLDLRNCENAVMVGSGAFPGTLLWLRGKFPRVHYVGLDIDADCVKMATELVAAMGFDNVRFEQFDGQQYDFTGIDFVYVANHVVPKKAVLQQIARSPSVHQVVVREPTPVGELLSEAVRPDLPPTFVPDASNPASGLMSYDLLLRRV